MTTSDQSGGTQDDPLLDFFHVCPVGLVSFSADGSVRLINPEAVSLLFPALGGRSVDNIFLLLGNAWPELEALPSASDRLGRIVESHRLPIGAEPHVVWLSLSVV